MLLGCVGGATLCRPAPEIVAAAIVMGLHPAGTTGFFAATPGIDSRRGEE